MPETLTLTPGALSLADIERLRSGGLAVAVEEQAWAEVERSARLVLDVAAGDARVYGINTGFGSLARTAISRDRINDLQRRIVLSHAAGTGAPLPDPIVRLVLALKINALALGLSGCQRTTIEALVRLYNHDALPVIPAKGRLARPATWRLWLTSAPFSWATARCAWVARRCRLPRRSGVSASNR